MKGMEKKTCGLLFDRKTITCKMLSSVGWEEVRSTLVESVGGERWGKTFIFELLQTFDYHLFDQ